MAARKIPVRRSVAFVLVATLLAGGLASAQTLTLEEQEQFWLPRAKPCASRTKV